MKSTRPARAASLSLGPQKVRASRIWASVTSLWLSQILLSMVIVLSFLGAVIPYLSSELAPEQRYLLEQLGFADIFHSGWFIFVLGMLLLNLLLGLINRGPVVWKQAGQKIPTAINIAQVTGAKKSEKFLFMDLQCNVHREEFRELASKWSRSNVGKALVLRDEGGLNELQLVTQKGRFARVSMLVAHVGLIVVLLGAMISAWQSFEGRVSIDAGSKVNYIEAVDGAAPPWPVLKRAGAELPGFYEIPFEIEAERFDVNFYKGTENVRALKTKLVFHQNDRKVGESEIAVNKPGKFEGLTFHQMGFAKTAKSEASIRIRDRENDSTELFAHAVPGSGFNFGTAKFRVIDIQESMEDFGAGVQVEYRESVGKDIERFWLFLKFPGFDSVHRKRSRYIFEVEKVDRRFSTEVLVSKDPGLPLVLGGAALMLLALIYGVVVSHRRFWFIWNPGRVTIVGWSSKSFLFEPDFEKSMEKFKTRLGKVDKSVKSIKMEIQHGSL